MKPRLFARLTIFPKTSSVISYTLYHILNTAYLYCTTLSCPSLNCGSAVRRISKERASARTFRPVKSSTPLKTASVIRNGAKSTCAMEGKNPIWKDTSRAGNVSPSPGATSPKSHRTLRSAELKETRSREGETFPVHRIYEGRVAITSPPETLLEELTKVHTTVYVVSFSTSGGSGPVFVNAPT